MEAIESYYDLARIRTEEQDKRRIHFDTMASAMLGVSGAIVALTGFTTEQWTRLTVGLFGPVLLIFLLTAHYVYNELALRGWILRPVLKEYAGHIYDPTYLDTELVFWAATEMDRANAENEQHLTDKAYWLDRTYKAFVALVSIASLFIAATNLH